MVQKFRIATHVKLVVIVESAKSALSWNVKATLKTIVVDAVRFRECNLNLMFRLNVEL